MIKKLTNKILEKYMKTKKIRTLATITCYENNTYNLKVNGLDDIDIYSDLLASVIHTVYSSGIKENTVLEFVKDIYKNNTIKE